MKPSIYDFIDWTKGDDKQIADAIGVTRQAVAAARKVRRQPVRSNHGGKRVAGEGKRLGRPPGAKAKQGEETQTEAG